MNTIQVIESIATNPRIRHGRPYILGTTLTVADVALTKIYHQLDADGIADWYGLSLPQVHAALAYYYEHKDEIDLQIREQIRRAEGLKKQQAGSENALLSR